MARQKTSQPTEVELQILRVLWDQGSARVRDIHSQLHDKKGTNYSTTVKMLAVMLEKGLVRRDETESPYVYTAAVSRNAAGRRMVRDLISKVYDGAAMSLVLHALSSARATPEELQQVRDLLDRMEEE